MAQQESLVQFAMKNGEQMQNQVIAKAAEDPDFRALLVSDPKAAVKQEFGIDLPDFMTMEVHEAGPTSLHLTLPPGPDFKLDERTLEVVAAGLSCCC